MALKKIKADSVEQGVLVCGEGALLHREVKEGFIVWGELNRNMKQVRK